MSGDAGAGPPRPAAPPAEVAVLGLDGSPAAGRTAALPDAFASPFRRDLVHKAYTILASHRYQPKGVHPTAGMDNSADSLDPPTGHGQSRVARMNARGAGGRGGEGGEVASTRGGRQAHPPRSGKRIHKRMNRTERRLALRSAIAATAMRGVVEGRGHRLPEGRDLPIVVSGELESIGRASELAGVIGALGLRADADRLARRRSRSGRSALRGRPKKAGKSILFVVGGGEGGGSARGSDGPPDRDGDGGPGRAGTPTPPPVLSRAAGSIPGVDVVRAGDLSVLDLAPGSEPGRLVVYTPDALDVIGRTTSSALAGRLREKRRLGRGQGRGRKGAAAPAQATAAEPKDPAAPATAAEPKDPAAPAPSPAGKEEGGPQ